MNKNIDIKKLKNILTDNLYLRTIKNRQKGKLASPSLWKASTNQTNIFKQKEARRGKQYNILLVLDTSGSIWNNRRQGALETAYQVLIDFFSNMDGVDFAVLGTHAQLYWIKEWGGKNFRFSPKDLRIWDNFGGIDFLKHTEFFMDVSLYNDNQPNTPVDSETYCTHIYEGLHGAVRAFQKKKGKNICIFLSDGGSSCDYEDCNYKREKLDKIEVLKDVIKQNSEILFYGMGVESKAILQYMPNADYVKNDNAEIRRNLLKFFKKNIKR